MSSESSTFASSSKEDDDFTCFIFHIGESFAGGRLPVKVGASFLCFSDQICTFFRRNDICLDYTGSRLVYVTRF